MRLFGAATSGGGPVRYALIPGGLNPEEGRMNEIEQREQAEQPLQEFSAEFPGKNRRRVGAGLVAAFVVVVLVVWVVLFMSMDNKIKKVEQVNAAQAVQIHQLQTKVASVDASLGAAVACLQTVGSTEGLCSKLVK